ncbi:hypothetical protein LF1_56160 [Rubripirellula obstinata]|uniref:Uncharacterized protein n=1 Tax=Rubripirellula obstinata TaxID=406547 RepID=A0A5B1CCI9_9BACT|nr:hypothetical protein LF1_59020 [Rubripirellula obstinata]KAA1257054.1 hypothetical protein LF1_56160 [Rubripirellula obstinata]
MPRRAVGISVLFEQWGKAVQVEHGVCPAGREEGSECPQLSRITVCITEVAGFDVQAERKVCGRHSGACNGYPRLRVGGKPTSRFRFQQEVSLSDADSQRLGHFGNGTSPAQSASMPADALIRTNRREAE